MKERYALVKFQPYEYEYIYKCDKNIKKGNIVYVPVENEKNLKEVIVSKIKYCTEKELPISKEKIKQVYSIAREIDIDNQFYENLDELYAYKKDLKAEKNWEIKKITKHHMFNNLQYKYTVINKQYKTRLHIYGDGKNFIIDCYVVEPGCVFLHKQKIRCCSKQEKNFVLNKLKVTINKYYVEKIDDDYYIQYLLRDPKSFEI